MMALAILMTIMIMGQNVLKAAIEREQSDARICSAMPLGLSKNSDEREQARPKVNPLGLVYDGALIENVEGEVQLHPVSYDVGGLRVSANVYMPKGYAKDGQYAAVVVSHPNGCAELVQHWSRASQRLCRLAARNRSGASGQGR